MKKPEQELKNGNRIANLNMSAAAAVKNFKPPEDLTVTEWADKNRRLSPETSAEAGPWRTSRVPYLKDLMDAFTDPKVRKIVMVAASQVGKSELILNIIGYIIDQDPGSILFIQPGLDDARKFSKLRVAPMIRDCKVLRSKVAEVKSRDSSNTIFQKSFPGGMLTITGTNSAPALASIPARYILGDERDRWAVSAGTEGDPMALAEARQTTFDNAKSVEVSTPTIKGASNIETSYYQGTQERWKHQCPECGEWHEINFSRIRSDHESKKVKGRNVYRLTRLPVFSCPGCGCVFSEEQMRKQPAKWIVDNPEAYEERGIRSFWLNAFSSPWVSWDKIVLKFIEADKENDNERLQVVVNTMLGELWENRGEMETEEGLMARREEYEAELPDGVLVLTCGVDTQNDRLEYEVLGHGRGKETWGIVKGFIMGRPDTDEPWNRLDDVLDRVYKFKNGRGLKISVTLVDAGGHFATEVKTACKLRFEKRVFAINGRGGQDIPHVSPATRIPVKDNKKITCWHYTLGVDAGKAAIMRNLKVQQPGPGYCHFPLDEERGYDYGFFHGLLSEKLDRVETKTGAKWQWVLIPGHKRNEALDCRNYALAGFRILNLDLDAVERRLKEIKEPAQHSVKKPRKRSSKRNMYADEW